MPFLRSLRGLPILLLAFCPALFADGFDINLNDSAVRLFYVAEFESRGIEIDGGFLHSDDDGDVASLGLHAVDFTGSTGKRWRIGVGGKIFYVDSEVGNADGGALGLGGHFAFLWPGAERFEIGGHLYWAPDVVSFGDLDDYRELGITGGFKVIERATIYIGLRQIRADYENVGDVDLDSGLYGGFRIRF